MKTFTQKEINKINNKANEVEDKIRSIVDTIKPNYKQSVAEEMMLRECGYYDMKDIVDSFYQMKDIEAKLNSIREHTGIRRII